jgi:hypothetical protein
MTKLYPDVMAPADDGTDPRPSPYPPQPSYADPRLDTTVRRLGHLRHALRKAIWDYCQAQAYNPWEAMVRLVQSTDFEMVALACHKEIAPFLLPKLKQVELGCAALAERRIPA